MELIVVFGIVTLLFAIGFVAASSISINQANSISTSTIISDIKAQQIKAMVGDTEGTGTPDTHGVKILLNSYVLFHGNSYDPSNSSNFEIPMPANQTLTTTFPNQTIIFSLGSGEISGFSQGQNTITITNTNTNQVKVVQFNKFGTVSTIN